ncbi:MAG TPA: hypothetical protein PKE69_10330 [Pyrinomonadaceae bacterium]|nr:hypothetical protein [Pyrinomonadaceae bacterium]
MNRRFICINLTIVFIFIGTFASGCNKSVAQNDSNRTNDLESLEKNVPMPESNESGLTAPVPLPDPYNKKEVNRKNFEQIKVGMTEYEVQAMFEIMEDPLITDEDYEQKKANYRLVAPDGKGQILITLQNGKVSEKKAIDLK